MGVFMTSLSQVGCFFRSCNPNRTKKVTLQEWAACLLDRTEAWFYTFVGKPVVLDQFI